MDRCSDWVQGSVSRSHDKDPHSIPPQHLLFVRETASLAIRQSNIYRGICGWPILWALLGGSYTEEKGSTTLITEESLFPKACRRNGGTSCTDWGCKLCKEGPQCPGHASLIVAEADLNGSKTVHTWTWQLHACPCMTKLKDLESAKMKGRLIVFLKAPKNQRWIRHSFF